MTTPAPERPGIGPVPHVPVAVPMSAEDQRTWSTLIQLSPIVAGIVGLPFLGPLIGYLVLRERGDFVRFHSAQALNLALTSLIAALVTGALCFVVIGFVLLPAVGIASLVLMIVAAVKAHRGEYWRIPATIPFVS